MRSHHVNMLQSSDFEDIKTLLQNALEECIQLITPGYDVTDNLTKLNMLILLTEAYTNIEADVRAMNDAESARIVALHWQALLAKRSEKVKHAPTAHLAPQVKTAISNLEVILAEFCAKVLGGHLLSYLYPGICLDGVDIETVSSAVVPSDDGSTYIDVMTCLTEAVNTCEFRHTTSNLLLSETEIQRILHTHNETHQIADEITIKRGYLSGKSTLANCLYDLLFGLKLSGVDYRSEDNVVYIKECGTLIYPAMQRFNVVYQSLSAGVRHKLSQFKFDTIWKKLPISVMHAIDEVNASTTLSDKKKKLRIVEICNKFESENSCIQNIASSLAKLIHDNFSFLNSVEVNVSTITPHQLSDLQERVNIVLQRIRKNLTDPTKYLASNNLPPSKWFRPFCVEVNRLILANWFLHANDSLFQFVMRKFVAICHSEYRVLEFPFMHVMSQAQLAWFVTEFDKRVVQDSISSLFENAGIKRDRKSASSYAVLLDLHFLKKSTTKHSRLRDAQTYMMLFVDERFITSAQLADHSRFIKLCRNQPAAALRAIKWLNFEVDKRDHHDDTAYIAAAKSGNVELLSVLESRGVDKDAINWKGESALKTAMRYVNVAAVKYLFDPIRHAQDDIFVTAATIINSDKDSDSIGVSIIEACAPLPDARKKEIFRLMFAQCLKSRNFYLLKYILEQCESDARAILGELLEEALKVCIAEGMLSVVLKLLLAGANYPSDLYVQLIDESFKLVLDDLYYKLPRYHEIQIAVMLIVFKDPTKHLCNGAAPLTEDYLVSFNINTPVDLFVFLYPYVGLNKTKSYLLDKNRAGRGFDEAFAGVTHKLPLTMRSEIITAVFNDIYLPHFRVKEGIDEDTFPSDRDLTRMLIAKMVQGDPKLYIFEVILYLSRIEYNYCHDDYTLLLAAVSKNDGRAFDFLVNHPAVNINAANHFGETALLSASRLGNEDYVGRLLAKGADILHTNNAGESAMMLAISNGHFDVARRLVFHLLQLKNGKSVLNDHLQKTNNNNQNVLSQLCAVEGSKINKFFEFLLGNEFDVNSQHPHTGCNILMMASYAGKLRLVLQCVLAGANTEAQDAEGKKPGDYARAGKRDVIIGLLSLSSHQHQLMLAICRFILQLWNFIGKDKPPHAINQGFYKTNVQLVLERKLAVILHKATLELLCTESQDPFVQRVYRSFAVHMPYRMDLEKSGLLPILQEFLGEKNYRDFVATYLIHDEIDTLCAMQIGL